MTTPVYRDPHNLEEAMRELRPLRKTVERLRAEVASLNSALTTTSEGNAKLRAEVAALKGNASAPKPE